MLNDGSNNKVVSTSASNGLLTKDQFLKVLPTKFRSNITDETIDGINNLMVGDSYLHEVYRENLISYTSVLSDGRFKVQKYIDAVRYVSFKLLGSTNIVAYTRAFPDRYQKFIDDGVSEKDISSYVCAYNRNKLVQLIFEQTLTPYHVLNADLYQKALNVQAELMTNPDVSYKVQSDAANSLLTHLKPPETSKIELDINLKEDSAINELRQSTLELVKQQKLMIESNSMSAEDIAHSTIVSNID